MNSATYQPVGLIRVYNQVFCVISHSLAEKRTSVVTANCLHLVMFLQLGLLTFNSQNPSLVSSYLGNILPTLAYLNVYPPFMDPSVQVLGDIVLFCLLCHVLRLYYVGYTIYHMQDQ